MNLKLQKFQKLISIDQVVPSKESTKLGRLDPDLRKFARKYKTKHQCATTPVIISLTQIIVLLLVIIILSLLIILIFPLLVKKVLELCSQHPISHFVSYNLYLHPIVHLFLLCKLIYSTGLEEAIAEHKWKETIVKKMRRAERHLGRLPLPSRKKAIGCKPVFTVTPKAYASVELC